jgi:DNA-binding LacI/PurR family transcriptional regulator
MIIDRNSPVPQYFQLQNWLIEQIEMGIFKAGDRIPTEQEFVRITGSCRLTVRQAIQNLVNLGYLTRRRRSGTFVLNRSNQLTTKTIIGIMIPDIRAGCMAELARGAEDEAAQNKHNVILCNTDDLHIKALYHVDRLIEHQVTGVVYVPIADADAKNKAIIEKFQQRNIPVVMADRIVPGMNVDYVTTDNESGGYLMTRHLILHGHSRIAVLLNNLVPSERHRLAGYQKAMLESHIPVDDSLIVTPSVPFSENTYSKYAAKLLANRRGEPLAIFAGHDLIAMLFYTLAREMHLSIPDDFSLAGYDDLAYLKNHPIRLTTIHQPIYEMGRESIRLMLSRINNSKIKSRHIVLKSHLIERSSVKDLNQRISKTPARATRLKAVNL